MSEVQRYGMQWHEVTEQSVFMADEDGDYVKFSDYEKLQQQVNQLAAENYAMKSILNSVADLSNEPEFHEQGMGCGIEDRGITDRYAAMEYGWNEAMERVYGEVIPKPEEFLSPHTDAFLLNAQADGLDKLALITGEKCEDGKNGIFKSIVFACTNFSANLRAQATALQQKGE